VTATPSAPDGSVPRDPLTRYYTAVSLDGFIADPDNSLQWLFDVPSGPGSGANGGGAGEGAGDTHEPALPDFGAMAMGATTYLWLLEHESMADHPERWADAHGDVPCWVFSHRRLPTVAGADIRFVEGPVAPVHAEMAAAAAGRTVWLVGGGELVGQFHDAGLLDQVVVAVAPVTLGAGAPLLPRRIESLVLTDVRRDGQRVSLTYDVGRRPGRAPAPSRRGRA
jgi:dihydrofolate reductase